MDEFIYISLEKALDKGKLVLRKVPVRGENGKINYENRWVDPNKKTHEQHHDVVKYDQMSPEEQGEHDRVVAEKYNTRDKHNRSKTRSVEHDANRIAEGRALRENDKKVKEMTYRDTTDTKKTKRVGMEYRHVPIRGEDNKIKYEERLVNLNQKFHSQYPDVIKPEDMTKEEYRKHRSTMRSYKYYRDLKEKGKDAHKKEGQVYAEVPIRGEDGKIRYERRVLDVRHHGFMQYPDVIKPEDMSDEELKQHERMIANRSDSKYKKKVQSKISGIKMDTSHYTRRVPIRGEDGKIRYEERIVQANKRIHDQYPDAVKPEDMSPEEYKENRRMYNQDKSRKYHAIEREKLKIADANTEEHNEDIGSTAEEELVQTIDRKVPVRDSTGKIQYDMRPVPVGKLPFAYYSDVIKTSDMSPSEYAEHKLVERSEKTRLQREKRNREKERGK